MNEIKLFENQQIRSVWDEEKQEWFFSVVDIVAVLTESTDPKQYIKKMRSRDAELAAKWGTICTPVAMMAMDGKKRQVQAADMTGIFRIIQSIPSPKMPSKFNREYARMFGEPPLKDMKRLKADEMHFGRII
ncbi:MAG: ATPase [Actinobacillus porcinus]|uniref:BRO family protein n=1 Tax=Actinobacillus minor TaxID=51047 RepID=UPI0023525E20|nr:MULTISPECIES: BRO family protein [Actinobacillus]MDY5848956.1 ATPase [Actinobacillus porcinus]